MFKAGTTYYISHSTKCCYLSIINSTLWFTTHMANTHFRSVADLIYMIEHKGLCDEWTVCYMSFYFTLGYTFSSPKWRSDPQEKIHQITNTYPNHTADAFYYPRLKSLPPIAKVSISLVNSYQGGWATSNFEYIYSQNAS